MKFDRGVRKIVWIALWVIACVNQGEGMKVVSFPQTCGKNLERMEEQPNQEAQYSKAVKNGSFFNDPMFPADPSSLFWKSHKGADTDIIKVYEKEVTKWQRPFEIIHRYQKINNTLPDLFGNGSVNAKDPGSVGALGDGWFLGAAVSLAEFPEYVKSLFVEQKYVQAGVFQIKLFLNGKWRKVVVDDRLPMLKNNLPVNAGPSQGGGWWLPLIEKAYAKMNVNYENLNKGRPENVKEALRALTGMPVKELRTKQDDFVEILKQSFMQNYAMNVYVPFDKLGLKQGRTYNIIDLIEVNDEDDDERSQAKIVAVKLRDPWTDGKAVSYSGPEFSRYGQSGTNEFNKTFLMSVKDFRDTFDSVYVAMIARNWIITQQRFEKSKDDNYKMIIENNGTQNAYLTLDYPTKRMYAPGCPVNTRKLQFTVKVQSLKEGTVYNAATTIDPDTSFGMIDLLKLPPGQYLVTAEMRGDLDMAPGFTVSIYSNKSAINFKDKYYVLSKSLYDAMGRKDNKVYQSFAQNGMVQVNSYLDDTKHLSVEIVKKKKADYKIIIQVKTRGKFPLRRTKSNTDWRNGLVVQNATLTEADRKLKFYQMTVSCPQDTTRCIYVIPNSQMLVGIFVEGDKA